MEIESEAFSVRICTELVLNVDLKMCFIPNNHEILFAKLGFTLQICVDACDLGGLPYPSHYTFIF